MEREDREQLLEKVQEVLDETFDDNEKRHILEYEDRVNFACPYCGDSDNHRKKRANIYLTNLSFHCFNCDKHTDYIHFLHDFGVSAGGTIEIAYSVIKERKRERNYVYDLGLFKKIDEHAFTFCLRCPLCHCSILLDWILAFERLAISSILIICVIFDLYISYFI